MKTFCGAGGTEVEPKDEILPDINVLFTYLTELLDAIDAMEKSAKKED